MINKKQNVLKTIKVLLSLAILLFTMSSCSLLPEEKDVYSVQLNNFKKFEYNYFEVQRRTYIKLVEGEGIVTPINQSDVCFVTSGYFIKNIHVKLGDFVKKGDILIEANTDELDYKIKKQENAYKLSQVKYDRISHTSKDKLDVEKTQISLNIEKIKLENLKQQREKLILTAPMDGVIIYSADTGKGSIINANEPMFQIADTKDIQIVYKSNEAKYLKSGMKVTVQFMDEYFQGEVASVYITNKSEEKSNTSPSIAAIKLFRMPENMGINESVNITIEVLKKDNVIVIPGTAIATRDGKNYVVLLENNSRVEKEIKIGFEMGYDVEVISGLNIGDKIIID